MIKTVGAGVCLIVVVSGEVVRADKAGRQRESRVVPLGVVATTISAIVVIVVSIHAAIELVLESCYGGRNCLCLNGAEDGNEDCGGKEGAAIHFIS